MVTLRSSLFAAALALSAVTPAAAQTYDADGDFDRPGYVSPGYGADDDDDYSAPVRGYGGYAPAYGYYDPSREAFIGADGYTRTRCRPHRACYN